MTNILILLISLAVYGSYGLTGLLYLLAAVLVSFGAGLLTKRHRWVMWGCVGLNAAVLVLVKLLPLTQYTLAAPLGISYFTLQLISYNVDVYRGKCEPERNLYHFALCVTYIPRLFIGPIQSHTQMKRALFEQRRVTWDGISAGAARAVWGLAKKLMIASRAGVIVSAISSDPETFRGAYALAAMLLYSVQLYCDFSGGIDMVLGVSKMLGITLGENFDAPYFSQSVQEFWRRWHISLGAWLREYIYIPLGGNRKGRIRKLLNTVAVFLVSGLWHGVHYLLWGLINGVLVCFGKKCQTKWKWLNQLLTFCVITLLWSFFVWPETVTALKMVGSVFTVFNYSDFFAQVGTMGLVFSDWIVLAVGVIALWGYDAFRGRIEAWFLGRCPAARTAVACFLGLIVLVFGMYGIGFDAEAFIYSRF